MAGMDHSAMAAPSAGGSSGQTRAAPMTGMDHSNMPGMGATGAAPAAQDAMPAMDHSNMPGMQPSSAAAPPAAPTRDAGYEKLRNLVAELLEDTTVQRRVQQDPALREAWADPAVRQVILADR